MSSLGPKQEPIKEDATGSSASPESMGLEVPTIIKHRGASSSSLVQQGGGLILPQPGDRIDSYELQRPIGIGGMGAVFLALDLRLQREVALKILPPEQSNDSEVVQRFYQEARAAARLDHENIARVFTIGSDKGYHFIAFEYIEGLTLRQRVHEVGRLDVAEAINYTLQMAGALVHASERGVVHRDIKPSNIIVTPHGRVKLVDMGLARRFEKGDDGLTQSGMTLGTFDYISPEQARDPRDVDVRGDLYSLGCTLFHMLTGRPPFPDGTVLQKLLQHQEDPPPDVRSLNPEVPGELSVILMKLMAKDRERRYQTPEQLVRDLLTLAGSLGLRSLSPEGLVWMAPRVPPPWEKHLVWGIPVMALAAVVGILVWWGQPVEPSTGRVEPLATNVTDVKPTPVVPLSLPKDKEKAEEVKITPPAKEAAIPKVSQPREVQIRTGENLSDVIAREASGSTIILSEDGPYTLAPATVATKVRKDLTIRSAPGVHPIIRPARSTDASNELSDSFLMGFGPGFVTIDSVEFVIDPGESNVSLSAIRCSGTDLNLKSCSFRSPTGRQGTSRLTAIQLRRATPDTTGTTSIRADSTYFEAGMVAIGARGPSSIQMRDCTFGAQEPSFLFDNTGSAGGVSVELVLKHSSFQIAGGPLLRSINTDFKAVVEDCVVATLRDRTATLVEIDDPDRLYWRGKGNLYSGIETFLRPTRGLLGRGIIAGFDAWADDPRAFREALSMSKEPPIWETSEFVSPMERANPTSLFVVGTLERPSLEVGARRGPRGRIVPMDEGFAAFAGLEFPPKFSETTSRPAQAKLPEMERPASVEPQKTSSTEVAVSKPMPMPTPLDRDIQPMPSIPMEKPPDEPSTTGGTDVSKPIVPATANEVKAEKTVDDAVSGPETGVVRTQAGFLAGLERVGPRGGTIKIAADADITLTSSEIKGPGRIIIQAEDGISRPALRFRPNPPDLSSKTTRASLFSIRGGSVELQGVDIILDSTVAPERGDWCVFRLSAGAEITLTRSTVTVEGRSTRSAVVLVNSGDGNEAGGGATVISGSSQFRANESLIRSSGDILDVASGHRLEAEFTNIAVASGGSLVHGHGMARGQEPQPLRIVLRQVSGRFEGGLAFLESAPGEPDLPQVDVSARDSIITTNEDGAPLFRIDGQEDLDSLRHSVKWDGNNVHYHKIEVYRRDQTTRPGTLPLSFDRPSWDVAVAPRDLLPFHGDVRFIKSWDSQRPLWEKTKADFATDPQGPADSVGADLRRIPQVGSSRSELRPSK